MASSNSVATLNLETSCRYFTESSLRVCLWPKPCRRWLKLGLWIAMTSVRTAGGASSAHAYGARLTLASGCERDIRAVLMEDKFEDCGGCLAASGQPSDEEMNRFRWM